MLAFLLSFMGLGAAAAAAGSGGGSDESPSKEPEILAPPPLAPDKVKETVEDHGTGHGDMDHKEEDVTEDHGTGHGDMDHKEEDVAEDHGTGHGDMDHKEEDVAEDHGTGHDDMGHEDHTGSGALPLPANAAEINAFVAAVRASPEHHSHDSGSSKAGEHMAAMDLVPRDEATHIAISHGDWDDPSNWYSGEVPGDDARVLIPEGVHMTYDHVSDARLFTVRVDGELKFATDTNSQMVVDTLVITPTGALEIGTEADPVDANVNVDIIFANNGAIDTDWDPMLLSRGMIAHGKVDIHGTEKDLHDKVADDPMAGDTWVDMKETPEGWAVGDTIVIAGTRYDGHSNGWEFEDGSPTSQDEIRVITQIEDGMVFFDDALEFDHASPRDDLKTSVANYTRNVSFETENAELAEIHERGHVMFMHNDEVDVRYAEFHELGRTDKSETARNADEFNDITFDSNVKGRYSFHFHRAGADDLEDPAIATGNAVFGSPGWGFVHHDSNALLENNASYDTFGAGFVAESGNETGAWNDNIAIFAQGVSWGSPKLANDVDNFDLGKTGDGFWFQGRMVDSSDNVAASVHNGFVYFHRGNYADDANIKYDSELSVLESPLTYNPYVFPDDHPILSFSGNETFAAKNGLHVVKANASQGHDVHSVLDDFTAWNVDKGAALEYTSHYILSDFDIVGDEGARTAFSFGQNMSDITIIDPKIENFDNGISLFKNFTSGDTADEHEYTVINPTFIDVENPLANYDPELDTLIYNVDEIQSYEPDLVLDGPLTYREGTQDGARKVLISGVKRDSLGETDFPGGSDNYDLNRSEVVRLMEEEGYYNTSEGQKYFMLDIHFSDRISGDIYVEKHPVWLDDNVGVGTWKYPYDDVPYNGVQDLDDEGAPVTDAATLWATLTDGKVIIEEDFAAKAEEDKELLESDFQSNPDFI